MQNYDVIVLGSGLGGSITSSILANKGWRVLMIDAASHPRFAIGEATTPDISFLLKIVGKKYQVPELSNLATFHDLRDNVSSKCGTKKAFTFLYHRDRQKQDPNETHQFPTLAPPLGPDVHMFRQDTDAYMMGVALDYGAEIRQNVRIEKFDFGSDSVVLTSTEGEQFQCRFVVDGSGFRSPLAAEKDLRDSPCRLKTRSRALFTHMIGVKAYDELADSLKDHGITYRFEEGTLHHVFDRGWMWVIPFNNHSDQMNPVCSVGVLLDSDEYPMTDMSPAEEFESIIGRFPQVAEQFRDAKPVRDWVRTGRIQYSSKTIVGERFCLLSHAAGFVDPLFSTGLNQTLQVIDGMIPVLDAALKNDDFCPSQFEEVDKRFQETLDYCDQIVANAFKSFGNFDLWDAWFRVWVAANFVGTTLRANLYLNYEQSGDETWLQKTNRAPFSGALAGNFAPHRELFEAADRQMQAFTNGHITESEAADSIRSLFRTADYLPRYFKWHDKNVRTTSTFTLLDLTRMFFWYTKFSPDGVADDLISFRFGGFMNYAWKRLRRDQPHTGARRRYVRDSFFAK